MESLTAEETEIVFIRFTSLMVTIEMGDSMVIHDVAGKIFTSSDGVIADFRDIRDKIDDSFRGRSALANPLQEIDVAGVLYSALYIFGIGD